MSFNLRVSFWTTFLYRDYKEEFLPAFFLYILTVEGARTQHQYGADVQQVLEYHVSRKTQLLRFCV